MLRTRGQTAGQISEISSLSEVEGCNSSALWLMVECSCTFPLRFCQNNGPSNFTVRANKLVLQFRSNRRVHGEGAECTIACSDFTPRAETNPVTCSPEGNVLSDKSRAKLDSWAQIQKMRKKRKTSNFICIYSQKFSI